MPIETFSSADAAAQIGCSERWLLDQLRARRFRGRKVGRHWRLTEDDIVFALDVCANNVVSVVEHPSTMPMSFRSLTPTSRRKLVGS